MLIQAETIPRFTPEQAQTFARNHFGVSAVAQILPSECDQNFLLVTHAGPECVLKIANSSASFEILEAQNAALEHLGQADPALHCPRILPTIKKGERAAHIESSDGIKHMARLLTYVPGHLLVDVAPHTTELLYSLGAFYGRLDQALMRFSHTSLKRELQWDLSHAGTVISSKIHHVADPERRKLIEHFHERFRKFVEPALPNLRSSVIHNDGNDYNVLVTGLDSSGGKVTGVIDFGDLIESRTVFDLAICAAYAILGKTSPLRAAADVVKGYHNINPLTAVELELLYDLMAMRLCTSVVIAARQKKVSPENPYLTVSEAPAWAALERLFHISPRLALYTFRSACGMDSHPQAQEMTQWFKANEHIFGSIVNADLQREPTVVFDLSPGSTDLIEVPPSSVPQQFTQALFDRMEAAGARVGIGRYDEARRSYTGDQYRGEGSEVEEWRTVHLGIDMFLKPGAPVFAPLDGTIHSFANNPRPFDYGPTLILQHKLEMGFAFFTLYGHLSVESLDVLTVGMDIPKGRQIGTVGDTSINGQWPPHLHFQLILDMLNYSGDFPGVCAAHDRQLWLTLCPNPNLILRIPSMPKSEIRPSPEKILESRHRHFSRSLSVSYGKPLTLVQGWMQYVYDHMGREYLDAINNVCHVGHSHPAVVYAASKQMAILNTNTRYLHPNLVEYAERLCATLPEPLSICFFVCSGSEANELALRLAQAHTRSKDIIVVEGGYHGNTTALVNISSYKFDGPGGAGAPPHVHRVTMPDPYRGPYKADDGAGMRYAKHITDALQDAEQSGRKIGAFICESMLSCGGQIVLPPGYLTRVYDDVRATGGVCIADEIQVGLGRIGSHFWGFQTQDVVPDIVTMGKPIGNGHPLGAVVTTKEIASSFENGMEYFNTFGGNPVSCAVGLAVLDVIEREELQKNALVVGRHLKQSLNDLMSQHHLIGDVRGEGLFLGIELVRNRETLEQAGPEAGYISERMKEFGVLVSTDGPFHNVLKIKPPMVFTKGDADRLTTTLNRVLSEPRLHQLRVGC